MNCPDIVEYVSMFVERTGEVNVEHDPDVRVKLGVIRVDVFNVLI
jgi:hypothetical protein